MKFTNTNYDKSIAAIGWIFVGGVVFFIYFYTFLVLYAFTPFLPSNFLTVSHKVFGCSVLISDLSAVCKFTNFILLALHELTHYLLFLSIFCLLFHGALKLRKINFSVENFLYFLVGVLVVWLIFFLVPLIFSVVESGNEISINSLIFNIGELFLFLCAVFFLGRRRRGYGISKTSS
ncbi:magnesium-transporting ATPase (P-type) [Acidovorax soli]|uniref:Magnesium-transporting ATPase (P-type) n=1 Tax=Acidovorax soli TaxID=592050 RepID=A0A7X0PHK3_9BURK|nr:hypothetical protein [Acidovorax soli]MBB6562107.1 magnesium-transporting ATPase (P-type) [Acidovorax soli]